MSLSRQPSPRRLRANLGNRPQSVVFHLLLGLIPDESFAALAPAAEESVDDLRIELLSCKPANLSDRSLSFQQTRSLCATLGRRLTKPKTASNSNTPPVFEPMARNLGSDQVGRIML